jgi:translation initiation factor 1
MTTTAPNPLDGILRELDAHEDASATVTTESRRYGKYVTVIEGLEGRRDLQDLLKDLKQRLATGGAAKAGRIELQGDHRRRAIAILNAHGVQVTR